MYRFLIIAAFGGATLRKRRLFEGGAYFGLSVKRCDGYLTPGAY